MRAEHETQVIPGWVSWIASAILTAMTVGIVGMSYLFTHFETTEAAAKSEQTIMQRLDRIENKIDEIKRDVNK